jgi:hypothetical protein
VLPLITLRSFNKVEAGSGNLALGDEALSVPPTSFPLHVVAGWDFHDGIFTTALTFHYNVCRLQSYCCGIGAEPASRSAHISQARACFQTLRRVFPSLLVVYMAYLYKYHEYDIVEGKDVSNHELVHWWIGIPLN